MLNVRRSIYPEMVVRLTTWVMELSRGKLLVEAGLIAPSGKGID